MAIAPVSFTSSNVPPLADPMRQALGQLTSAIQSGNLSAAQSAFSTLSQAAANNPNSPLAQALNQIGDALQSGDLSKAQQALTSLQQQMQATKGAHHHHGGHHHKAADADASQSTTSTTSTDLTAPASSTSLVDVTA
jgi:thioredoxin-like negative regulator of GroEL